MMVKWSGRSKSGLVKKKFLAVGEACVETFWPTLGFKGITCQLWSLNWGDLNFCVRSTPLCTGIKAENQVKQLQCKAKKTQIKSLQQKWLLYKLLCKTSSCDEQSHQQTDEWNWQPRLHPTLTLVVGVLQVVELFGEEVLNRHCVNRAQVSLTPQLTIQYMEDVIWNRGSTHTHNWPFRYTFSFMHQHGVPLITKR